MSHENLKGKVALLDLVSGIQICAEILEIGETTMTVRKPLVFQVAVEPQDPTKQPHPQMNPIVQKINAAPYGGPFAIPQTEHEFDLIHILAVHEPQGQIEKGYLQASSGIEIAGAETLAGLAKP